MAKAVKVLQFICSTSFYGAERWVLALANHLPKERITSVLAVTKEPNQAPLEVVEQFKNHYGEAFEVPMNSRFDLRSVSHLAKLINEQNIDIVHTHGYKSDIIGTLAAKKAGVKVVITPHGFENTSDFKLRSFIWIGCQFMRFADKVVPLSTQLLSDVKKFNIKEERLAYIQNGVDLSEVDAVRISPHNIEKTKKRIGFIGQMISRKNIDDILTIFAQLHAKDDQIELVLLGDGDERERLEKHANTLACNEDIHFLGYLDNRLEYLKSFDLFVMTSSLEGVPRCLMEACAMEIPVCAYNIAGIDLLIQSESTGLLSEFGDIIGLSEQWQTMLYNTEKANELAQNARNYVNTHFSAKRMAEEYTELFFTMLNNDAS